MPAALVLQTDFGTSDGAVSAMYGVALKVSPRGRSSYRRTPKIVYD